MTQSGETVTSQRMIRTVALAEVVAVAIIWSSSFVVVKIVLKYTGPFTVAGLRYFLAFLVLTPWLWRRRAAFGHVAAPVKRRLLLIGVTQYLLGNGALFLSLKTLPATTASLAMCLTSIPVLVLSRVLLKERLHPLQMAGVAAAIVGSVLFFWRGCAVGGRLAMGALGISVISFAAFPVLVRKTARDKTVGTIILTGIPLGSGGTLLLVVALLVEGVPSLPLTVWGLILGLALVNTLLGYLLFNHGLRQLGAVEANVLLNLSPLATALIAWGMLGERLVPLQIAAMALVSVGASLAQRRKPAPVAEGPAGA